MVFCVCVSEEGGDGEGAVSEPPSLLSYTLTRYVRLAESGRLCQFGLREPMHLCACVSEDGWDWVVLSSAPSQHFLKIQEVCCLL
jgi:hypothetical protein